MKNQYFIAIGILCILLFYILMNYFVLGGIQFSILILELSLGFFITLIISGFLGTKIAGLTAYSREQIFLSVAIVHIIAIVGFIMVLIVTSNSYLGPISPLTGHIVFLLSIAIQLAIVIPNYKERWLQIGSGFYLVSYLIFSLWQVVTFPILGLLFVYVVLYNISVYSYGVLQYIHHIKTKYQRLETE